MYVQAVFAVKFRNVVISKAWRPNLMGVIGNLINETGYKTLIVNGVEDHVHCFYGLIPSVSVSNVMKTCKAKSSKWINESVLTEDRFKWQRGFGAFSYSPSSIRNVYNYIQNQENHHRKQTFRNEYVEMLEEFKIEYDDRYLFDDLI